MNKKKWFCVTYQNKRETKYQPEKSKVDSEFAELDLVKSKRDSSLL